MLADSSRRRESLGPVKIAGAGLISATQADAAHFIGGRYESTPMAVTMFHGTSDFFVKYSGQSARRWGPLRGGGMLSAPATAEYFAQRNGILTPGRNIRSQLMS
ncbi:hypothetical protein GCM10007382_26930 [Salinibacterium xinjiangense]|nr:hypothetical protein GCM10007382_26930 [Salinibacterium xinjiangense]